MKINPEEIWATEIAVTSETVAENALRLEEMDIDSVIDDSDVRYVKFWTTYGEISCVEETVRGDFNITLKNGEIINSKNNPFEVK